MDADLLQDLHSELRRYGSARDELVERVREGHADAAATQRGHFSCVGRLELIKRARTMNHGRTRSTLSPLFGAGIGRKIKEWNGRCCRDKDGG